MEVSEVVRTKRAIRRFKDEALPEDAVEAILNAARRSPTSANSQYLTYTAIQDSELQSRLAEIRQGTGHLRDAPLVVVIVAQTEKWGTSIVNFDTGQAAAYMMLQAWSLGIGSNVAWFGGESTAGEVLNLPPGAICEWAISFGYPEDATATSAPMKTGGRKPLEDVVKWGRWE
jgi:nitroreductase